jgi:hypothetical protein
MLLTLRQQLSRFSHILQTELFPALESELGELSEAARRLVAVLELIPLSRFIPSSQGWNGRPPRDRNAIAHAFVAKAVYNLPRTSDLLDRLGSDEQLRLICGWKRGETLPHESTFSRAFAEFAQMELAQFVHQALVEETQKGRLIGHIARDATAIEARETFPLTQQQKAEIIATKHSRQSGKGKRGPHKRWKGGKALSPARVDTRLHRQRSMQLEQMLTELPRQCSIGVKTIPISAVLTGAKVHDSQVAIPLATMSSARVQYCYELMDSAYDAVEILEHSRESGHVPIVDPANRGRQKKRRRARPRQSDCRVNSVGPRAIASASAR